MRALLVLLALAFLPGIAHAHGGHGHDPAQAPQSEVRDWRPCPNGPADLCGCAELVACSSAHPLAVIGAPALLLQILQDPSRGAVPLRGGPFRSVAFPSARPRAPPAAAS